MTKNGKKKLVFQSDFALMKTGFGRNAKALLSYLYKTKKYDIVHYCCGTVSNDPRLQTTPWKSIGTIPHNQPTNSDPEQARRTSYGANLIDEIIKQEKPDVYIGCQDIWGVDFALEKEWFNELTSAIWTTLDSLPIIPTAIKCAKEAKNYWVWSNFAEKELKRLGFDQIKTLHGCIDHSKFRRLENKERKNLRKKFGIRHDEFIIGFVFRNQLRKLVPNLIEGFSMWKNKTGASGKLLLHTHWDEGWNILRLADEYQVQHSDILTTYKCSKCKSYEIKNFQGQGLNCRSCGSEKSQVTSNILNGVSEIELNEIYNLMDVYCHPFTSGGQEIPIQEAKMAELITLVTNYSCGEESCEEGSQSIPLKWSEYREIQTLFRKASTYPSSICEGLVDVYEMGEEEKRKKEKLSRQWAVDNFSIEKTAKFIESFIDEAPKADYSKINIEAERNDPEAKIEISPSNTSDWLISMYKKILKRHRVTIEDEGYQYWIAQLQKGVEPKKVEEFFRKTAAEINARLKKFDLNEFLDDDEGRRILYVIPESMGDVFLSTALFKPLKETYPDFNLYVATNKNNFPILEGNPYVYKVIPYFPQMDRLLWLEGSGEHKGYFEIALLPHLGTQKLFNYQHNGIDKINFDLRN
jgi:glycosyltransferase involved in cell wall biosynthesis